MELRHLGESGLVVSAVGLGCNNLGRPGTAAESLAGSRDLVSAALDAGVTLFDVADVYGAPRGRSEELLGQALVGRRDKAVVATKFGLDMQGVNGPDFGARGSRRYVRRAAETSLRRLGTDWIDLYQLHRPDPGTPIEETLSALDDLVRDGLIRYAGVCNLAAWQIADVCWTARTEHVGPVVSAQNQYSLLERDAEREFIPACTRFSVHLLPYFPLANGLLTGKYARGEAPPDGSRLAGRQRLLADAPWDRIEKLRAFAGERDISMTTLAIGWLAAQPVVGSVIAGATSADQVTANAAAANWRPTADDLVAIDGICRVRPSAVGPGAAGTSATGHSAAGPSAAGHSAAVGVGPPLNGR
ncbi:aldo/keto reductase [Actinokineospora inagensis]|uniref:aldo/keto reductase n=1 Tax=Actinokineospora inagensis TaxID=103730 RepID=UPI00040382CC|nr:aldo/keto reductase [Actinokineospora inagensis]